MRYFIKIVVDESALGVNLIWFDPEEKEVYQRTSRGKQEAFYERMSYANGVLNFKIQENKLEQIDSMTEISDRLGRTISLESNWDNLLTGLRNKSPKTLNWLQRKGIIDKSINVANVILGTETPKSYTAPVRPESSSYRGTKFNLR